MFTINPHSGMTIYEQLKRQIISLVLLDALKADDQITSVRQLAKNLGINPNTVQKAYQQLESMGIIYSRSGVGSFISPNINPDQLKRDRIHEPLQNLVKEAIELKIDKKELISVIEDTYKEKSKGTIL